MMATITETVNGFIAGDPPATLPHGHHWCDRLEQRTVMVHRARMESD